MDQEEALALLRDGSDGVKKWNQLRKDGIEVPSLCGVNFDNANLREVDLSDVDLSEGSFVNAVLIAAKFNNSNLQRANLRAAKLAGARFCNAQLNEADLSEMTMSVGVDFSGADMRSANFKDSNLEGVSFKGVDLSGISFSSLKLQAAGFEKANLSGVSFANADLREARFKEANCSSAIFSNAELSNTDFSRAIMINACITKANLSLSYLGQAILKNTDLSNSKLQGAKLLGTDLSGANLTEADLSEADCMNANFSGANLTGASLTQARFVRTNLSAATVENADVFDTQIHELRGFPMLAGILRLGALSGTLLTGEDARTFFAIPAIVEVYLSIRLTQIEVGCFYLHLGEVYGNGSSKGVYLIGHRHENDGSILRFQGKSFDDIYNVLSDYLAPFRRAAKNDWKQTIESLTESQRDEVIVELIKLETKTPVKRWKFAEMLAQVLQGFKYAQVVSIKESRNRGMLIRVANKPDIYDRLLPEVQDEKSVLTITVEGNATINSKLQSSQGEVMINEGDTYQIGQAGAVGRYARSDNNTFFQSEHKRTLFEAAAEIQQLLKQLEQTNPSATKFEQITYVNDETTPSFKRRVVGALQASGEAAIDEFVLENKYLKVVKAAVKGWLQPDS